LPASTKYWRRFTIKVGFGTHNFFSYRLDYLKNVKVLEQCGVFSKHLAKLENRLLCTWGVYLGKKNYIEQLEMVLTIDEESETYVLTRLKREGKHGTVEKLADNIFVYRIEVSDTQEMVPWLRTFIGRIISITGSNQRIIKQFRDDIERMAHMYED